MRTPPDRPKGAHGAPLRCAGRRRYASASRFPAGHATRSATPLSSSTATGTLARIAEDVGYDTDTAFSRAFRREFGQPPAAWRRGQRGAEAA